MATRHWSGSFSSLVAGQDLAAAAALMLQHIRPTHQILSVIALADTQIPRYPRYPVRMAKQSCQEVHSQEGRVPSNAFLRESSTSQENQICSNFVGKPGTNLDSNGPLASTFRCATLSI